jgi:hypothetical protein
MVGTPASQPESKQASLPVSFFLWHLLVPFCRGCVFSPLLTRLITCNTKQVQGGTLLPTKRHFNLTWPNPAKKTLKTRASPKADSAVCSDCPAGRLLLPLCSSWSVVVFCCAVPLRPSLLFYSECVALQTLVSATSGRGGGGSGAEGRRGDRGRRMRG